MRISVRMKTLGLALVALGVSAVLTSGAAAQTWEVQSLDTTRSWEGVSCTDDTACMTVGSDGATGKSLAAAYDGQGWGLQNVPNPSGTSSTALLGVSCLEGTGTCFAVGGADSKAMISVGGGGGWSSQTAAVPSGSSWQRLYDVSCTATDSCMAVGYYVVSSAYKPFTLEWDGSAWTQQTVPAISGNPNTVLKGVSCVADDDCMAVGVAGTQSLVEHWDGSSWSRQTSPSSAGAFDLRSVSCTASDECTAVGDNVALRWDGSSWSSQTLASGLTAFESVSCGSSADCTAVGGNGWAAGLIQHWDGSTWAVEEPNSPGAVQLNGVSCASDECAAVGLQRNIWSGGYDQLIERSTS